MSAATAEEEHKIIMNADVHAGGAGRMHVENTEAAVRYQYLDPKVHVIRANPVLDT